MVCIAFLFVAYLIATPMHKGLEDKFDNYWNFSDSRSEQAYDRVKSTTNSGRDIILYIFGGVFIIWAFSSMRPRERYSGVY